MIILVGLLLFGLVITIHELGHFLAAKALGIRVLSFSIGMGPRIWQRKIGETVYCLSVLPIGGYVRPLAVSSDGDALRTNDPRQEPEGGAGRYLDNIVSWLLPRSRKEGVSNIEELLDSKENLLKRGLLAQLSFILAGCATNIVSAVLLSALLLTLFVKTDFIVKPPGIYRVASYSVFARSGVMRGDRLLSIDGKSVPNWSYALLLLQVAAKDGRVAELEVKNQEDATARRINIAPAYEVDFNKRSVADILSQLGVKPETLTRTYTIKEALYISEAMLKAAFGVVFGTAGSPGAQESGLGLSISSPATTIVELGFSASESLEKFIIYFVVLSVVTALLNLLPIPGIDGGQFVVCILEHVFKVPITAGVRRGMTRFAVGLMMVLIVIGFGREIVGI